jgi:hypothetical protein
MPGAAATLRDPRRVALPWGPPSVRAVPSRFPPVSLFDGVASADELEAVAAIQALTHPRLRTELGELQLVARDEQLLGPGSTPVMAAFTHLNRAGSRFSDGSWGVYYAGESLDTAAAEVAFHAARFLGETRQPAIELDYRSYHARVGQPLHDLRGPAWKHVHAPGDYAPSQALARELRAAGSWGLLYRSVRRSGGECIALLRPRAATLPVVQGEHLTLHWDGQRIAGWYRKSGHRPLA